MRDRAAALAATVALSLSLFGSSAGASNPCGQAGSPASCLAACDGNARMQARRAALAARAERGDPDVLFGMGQSWLGQPGPRGVAACTPNQTDYRTAASWFRRAGELGHADAQAALGDYYELGLGGEKDYAQAFRWFHRAAAQDHARAIFRVGVFHDFGRSAAPKDAGIAALWYRRAAALGSCDAHFALATMYAQGRGVAPDPARAFALYDLVVEGEYPAACYGRTSGDARRARAAIAAQMTAAERTAARAAAAGWLAAAR